MTKIGNACPECGYEFQGNGWDGIDAHWKSKHEAVMSYKEAWPLISAGTYQRQAKHVNRPAARTIQEAD